jgi:hypothetical protein
MPRPTRPDPAGPDLDLLQSLLTKKPAILFFLGQVGDQRLPELLMVQDGVVKWMIEKNLITTYPSPLGYVNWSAKELINLSHALKIGLVDSGNKGVTKLEKTKIGYNLTFPGALIPGRGQVEAMIYLLKELSARPGQAYNGREYPGPLFSSAEIPQSI